MGPTPRPGIEQIDLYVGGKSHLEGINRPVKLSSNENPFGCSDKAREAYMALAGDLALYPSTDHATLREAIAGIHNLDPRRIVMGAGSDEIIALMCLAYGGPDTEVLYSRHGFLMYRISALASGATPVVAQEPSRRVDADAIIGAMSDATRLVFIANPNNPTGTLISVHETARIADAMPEHAILVLDGAYAEYVEDPDYDAGLCLARERDNVLMVRTFSKIHGLGGLRVGWAYGPQGIIDTLNRVRGPFNLSGPALAAAEAAINDTDYVDKCTAHNSHWRAWLARELAAIGIDSDPSEGNFILARFRDADQAARADTFLQKGGLIVRSTASYDLPEALRITIGDEDACRSVAKFLTEFMAGEP